MPQFDRFDICEAHLALEWDTLRGAIVCECGQWAWPYLPKGASEPVYRCVNDHYGGRIFHDDK